MTRISAALSALENQNQSELASYLKLFTEIVRAEKSDSLDKEALYLQTLILAEQAGLPKVQRKKILVTSALIYIGLFSSVRSIGSFLIEHRDRIDKLLD